MKKKYFLVVAWILVLLFGFLPAQASDLEDTANYLYKKVKNSSYDGMLDWPVLALAQTDKDVSSLISRREKQVRQGELFDPEINTDYQRTIVGAVAAGRDPKNFGQYNLIEAVKQSQLPTGKFADTISNGGDTLVNAHIWGIISLYVAGETIPNRDKALQWLIDHQNPDGGFSIDATIQSSDIDMTGMALIAFGALGENKNHPAVKKAITYLQSLQGDKGDFVSWGGTSSEALAQVIQGLVMLDIDPAGKDWTKKDGNLITALLSYKNRDGSFSHTLGGESNIIATYQSLLALNDYYRGESIYRKLRRENISFTDLPDGYFAADAVKKLAAEGIISGYPDGSVRPNQSVKRQEFVKMIVLALEGNQELRSTTDAFKDVPVTHWANPYIKAAVDKNLIKGTGTGNFSPQQHITGAQLMAMLVRASGLESSVQQLEGSPWYEGYVSLAREKGLLYPDFDPEKAPSRGQCAFSLVKLLN